MAQYALNYNTDLEDVIGIPCVFVVNPQGKLKTEYRRYANGKVVVGNFEWLDQLLYKEVSPERVPRERPLRIQDLDFDRRDTVDFSFMGNYTRMPRYCTPDGNCY